MICSGNIYIGSTVWVSGENKVAPLRPEEEENSLHNSGEKDLSKCKIMFKSGDDLRQDQLIMQLMELMDGLLRKVYIS
jgi:hypothetical protein